MHKISSLVIAMLGLFAAALSSQAAPMNKCVINGTVTFQQAPCPSNQVRKDPTIEELNAATKLRRAAAASAAAATPRVAAPATATATATATAPAPIAEAARFRCDGRTHCSQMRSCEEAKFFLANCPGTKMDGDRDGRPCELEWCTR